MATIQKVEKAGTSLIVTFLIKGNEFVLPFDHSKTADEIRKYIAAFELKQKQADITITDLQAKSEVDVAILSKK